MIELQGTHRWPDICFVPDVTGLKPFRKLNFSLVCPQNILGLEDHHDVFWQIRDECFCSFWSAVVFALELSHGCHSGPVSFLLVNHKCK